MDYYTKILINIATILGIEAEYVHWASSSATYKNFNSTFILQTI